MRVTYIGHSGFSVELESHILLFDYYEGTMPEFDPAKKLWYLPAIPIRIILTERS